MVKGMKSDKEHLEETLRDLEYTLFSEYAMDDVSRDEYMDLEFVFEKKITSEAGMVRLYTQLLKMMDVKHELVLTSDRDDFNFDQGFEGYNLFNDYMVYVNDLDMYWAPNIASRLGFPPANFTGTKGLFIREREIEGMVVALSKVKNIDFVTADKSKDVMRTKLSFNGDMTHQK